MSKQYLKTSIFAFICAAFSFFILLTTYNLFTKSIEKSLANIFELKNIDYPLLTVVLFFFLFLVSFLKGAFDLTSYFLEKKKINNFLLKSIIFVILFLILPFYILFHWYFNFIRLLITRQIFDKLTLRKVLGNIIFFLFVLLILTPVWILAYVGTKHLTTSIILKQLGYAPVTEYVAGTGSMYPTFPKGDKLTPIAQFNQTVATPSFISYPSGIVLLNKRYFGRNIERGDIVSFTNQKTLEITKQQYGVGVGYIKRVIGLSGDTIELRGGIVYLNGKPLKEAYTAKPQSTFGESFLSDCHIIKVPKGSVFVMGDNRKGSGDSREIGFVNEDDIDHVLPLENQKGVWDKNWRDTSKDFDPSSRITLDANAYLTLLNEKRQQADIQTLKYQPKLEASANLRGEAIIKFDDFSFSATRSGLTMLKAMQQVGYSNIVYGEAPTQGYYDASELIENQFLFPKTKEFLLDKDYQDFGIAEVQGDINNCPTQVIVQHFAGYIPPNYSQDLIKSWETALGALNDVAKSWENLQNNPDGYKKDPQDIDRIVSIIDQRQNMISTIVNSMQANQWLTDAQTQYITITDKALGQEENNLAKKINDLLK